MNLDIAIYRKKIGLSRQLFDITESPLFITNGGYYGYSGGVFVPIADVNTYDFSVLILLDLLDEDIINSTLQLFKDILKIVVCFGLNNKSERTSLISTFKSYGFLSHQTLVSDSELDYFGSFIKITPSNLCDNNYLYCSGCGCCANVCPQDAISIEEIDGFYRPHYDVKLCINCNKCIKSCPSLFPKYTNNKSPLCYAVKASEEILSKSSSGGIFTVLSEYIFKNGGFVIGAAWDSIFNVNLICITERGDLDKLRHSKYVQSNAGLIYRKVKECLETGPVLFTGLPCQVAGLYSYLGQHSDNLITVDLLCHGGASPTIFKKYLQEKTNGKATKVDFRVEAGNTWIHTITCGEEKIVCDKSDYYEKIFHTGCGFQEICKACPFSVMPRQGDFTIGDFWKLESLVKDWDSVHTSIVLINSLQAESIFNKVKSSVARYVEVPNYQKAGNRINCNYSYDVSFSRSFLKIAQQKPISKSVNVVMNHQHNVGLVGVYIKNFGTELTYYSLYKFLSDANYSTILIVDKAIDKKLIFENFISQPIPEYDLANNIKLKNFDELNNLCQLYLLGSDQLFNYSYVLNRKYYTCLDWVSSNKPMIGYATSFGVENLSKNQIYRAKMGYLLTRFDKISCREQSGVKNLHDIFAINAELVLDPVFLVSAKTYVELAKNAPCSIGAPFSFSYILDQTDKRAESIKTISKRLGVSQKVIFDKGKSSTSSLWEGVLENAFVEEWLSYMLNSEYVITDSFHGLCFALIFNKKFVVIFEDWQSRGKTRITSLLSLLGLLDRLVDVSDIKHVCDMLQEEINYDYVNSVIFKEREKSKKWLFDALNENYSKSFNLYDYMRIEQKNMLDIIDQLSQRLDILSQQFFTTVSKNDSIQKKLKFEITSENNLNGYLYRCASFSNCWILLSISGSAYLNWNKIDKILFGKQFPLTAIKKTQSFAAILDLDRKKLLFKTGESSNCFVTLETKKGDITVVSNTIRDIKSEFNINHKRFTIKNRGLNMLLISKDSLEVIDSINVDVNAGPNLVIQRSL